MGLVTSDITGPLGSALGPDWSSGLAIRGNDDDMVWTDRWMNEKMNRWMDRQIH